MIVVSIMQCGLGAVWAWCCERDIPSNAEAINDLPPTLFIVSNNAYREGKYTTKKNKQQRQKKPTHKGPIIQKKKKKPLGNQNKLPEEKYTKGVGWLYSVSNQERD